MIVDLAWSNTNNGIAILFPDVIYSSPVSKVWEHASKFHLQLFSHKHHRELQILETWADPAPEAPTWVGSGEGINRDKPFPRKICGETASNPRPGDSVRQLSPLHQACPSNTEYFPDIVGCRTKLFNFAWKALVLQQIVLVLQQTMLYVSKRL